MSDIKSGQSMCEYMTDSLFHGLRSILGNEIVDFPRLWHMYKDDKILYPERFTGLYGKGFTLYGLLPDDSGIIRDDIKDQLEGKKFDLVIATVHCSAGDSHQREIVFQKLEYLSRFYCRNQLIFIDTRDQSSVLYDFAPNIARCFKREFNEWNEALPISFSIPKEKIVDTIKEKTQYFGKAIPWHPYSFNNEHEYYEDYQKSWFGYTCKKGGWDSMRHYEILANGCVPFFTDLNECPKTTLTPFFPKEMLLEVLSMKGINTSRNFLGKRFERGTIDFDKFDVEKYKTLNIMLLDYTRSRLTTENMAKYLLEKVI